MAELELEKKEASPADDELTTEELKAGQEASADTGDEPRRSFHTRMDSTLMGEQQVEQLKLAFNLFDKDHSGGIDINELQTVLKTLGQNISKEETQEMMDAVDLNHDGTIDFHEFVQMMENRMFLPSNTMEYQDAFKFFDKNGDGFIDPLELRDVLMSLGEDFSDQDIIDMIKIADETGNGKVDFLEFLNMMPTNMQENYQTCKETEQNLSSAPAPAAGDAGQTSTV